MNNNQVAEVIDVPQALKMLEDIQAEFNHYHDMGMITSEIRNNILNRRAAAIARVPNFWRDAILGLRDPEMLITEEEQQVFLFLTNIEMESVWGDEGDIRREVGFRLKFTFGTNHYFTNAELVKEYEMPVGKHMRKKSYTPITWNGRERLLPFFTWPGVGPRTSFFSWFCANARLPLYRHIDNHIAIRIRDQLCTDPLKCYLQAQEPRMN